MIAMLILFLEALVLLLAISNPSTKPGRLEKNGKLDLDRLPHRFHKNFRVFLPDAESYRSMV